MTFLQQNYDCITQSGVLANNTAFCFMRQHFIIIPVLYASCEYTSIMGYIVLYKLFSKKIIRQKKHVHT